MSVNWSDDESIMPMFPLSAVLFPDAALPLHVFEPRYRQLVADVMTSNREFGIVLISRGSEVGGGDHRVSVGTVVTIEGLSELQDGQFALLVRGTQRLRVREWLEDLPYPRAHVERLTDDLDGATTDQLASAVAALRRARALLSELYDTPPLPTDLELSGATSAQLARAQWRLCMLSPFEAFDRQRLLESRSVRERYELLVLLCDDLARDVTNILSRGDEFEE